MKRTNPLAPAMALILSVWVAPSVAPAAEPAEIVELGDNLHLIQVPELPRTVMLVLTGPDGTLVVDYENPDLETFDADEATRERIDAALDRLGARPIRYLVNTHWHQDHVGANRELGGEALVIAHSAARRRLATRQTPWWLPEGVGPMAEGGLPKVTFESSATLHLNDEEIELLHFGTAHTDGDTVVWLKRANVVHMGDLFHGFDTLAAGIDMEGTARTYASLLERLPEDATIVTGHGPVVGVEDLRRSHRMLTDVLTWMNGELAAGASLEELLERPLPSPWDEAWPPDREIRARRLEMLHRSLEESPPTDEDRLRELHRDTIRAHLERDVGMLMAAEAADSVVSSRGEIERPTLDDRRAMFEGYFRATEFALYRDTAEPMVKISADGSLGWVIAQVEVAGAQTTAAGERLPLEFRSSWIELYEKRGGEWLRIGNVSNFAPRASAGGD